MENAVVGIGLIGAGRIGTLHARNIAASGRAHLAAVFDADAEAAQRLAQRFGGRTAESAQALIDAPVDAVFICSPTDTHVALIRACAKSGKAVFCEKPLDLDMASARTALDALDRDPVPFMMGFHRRFDPSTRRISEHLASGAAGSVEFMRVMSRDPGPPPIGYIQRSGGIFRDMTIHDLDLCRWLTGAEFTGVFAKGFCLIDPAIGAAGDFDTAFVTLWTEDGRSCVIQNSRRSGGGFDQRIEVMGSKAAVAMDNVPLTQTRLMAPDGLRTDALPNHFPERYRAAYVAQLTAFLDAIEEGGAPPTTALDGLAALQLADACARSAASGAPVTIEPVARSRASSHRAALAQAVGG